jgi:hypothetical protein
MRFAVSASVAQMKNNHGKQREQVVLHPARCPYQSPTPIEILHNGDGDDHQHQIEQRSAHMGGPPDASVE